MKPKTNLQIQLVALYTLIHRELVRMLRIFSQVFIPPVITTLLYFLIFGEVIGNRIGDIQGVGYSEFIAPGLIMMGVITNSYSNVSTSLFNVRFQKNIEEMLISPMHYSVLLGGFIFAGMVRGLGVALLIAIVSSFFVDLNLTHIFFIILIIILAAILFSLAGFTNGLLAKNFDEIALVPTFILGPLTYLGGVFYATSMLPPFWQQISYFNPLLYIINALRHVMIGQADIHIGIAMTIILALITILTLVNIFLLKKGMGIKNS